MFNQIHERESLLLLNRLYLTGGKSVYRLLLEGSLLPSQLVAQIEENNYLEKSETLKKIRGIFNPQQEIKKAEELGVRIICLGDPEYPELLKEISDPPLVLYYQGAIFENDRASVAIVGTRHPSFYGQTQTRLFSKRLAEQGLTIVSGFAKGVDQIAHQAACEISFGRTVAVLGCGLDVEYPKESRALFEKILEKGGAVISEYAFGTPPLAENFPRRNRIIAGLSRGALVIEAHSRSGSLITARLANEEGREVFALPGPVDQLTSRGTHQLIKEGAQLVELPEEITETLSAVLKEETSKIKTRSPQTVSLPAEEKEEKRPVFSSDKESRLFDILKGEGLAYEEIMNHFPEEAKEMASLLTRLELSGAVRRQYDGRFQALAKR